MLEHEREQRREFVAKLTAELQVSYHALGQGAAGRVEQYDALAELAKLDGPEAAAIYGGLANVVERYANEEAVKIAAMRRFVRAVRQAEAEPI